LSLFCLNIPLTTVWSLIISCSKHYLWLFHDVNFTSDCYLVGWIIKDCFTTAVLSRIVSWCKYYLWLFHEGSIILGYFMEAVLSWNVSMISVSGQIVSLPAELSRIVLRQQYYPGWFHMVSIISGCFMTAVIIRIVSWRQL
jgi:hypothetical protein